MAMSVPLLRFTFNTEGVTHQHFFPQLKFPNPFGVKRK